MPAFSVSKSIEVAVPAVEVFAYLRDFTNWPVWSPWLICDPECKVDYAADGDSYSWVGKFAGQGSMRVVAEDETHHKIEYALEFVKPWKSKADVTFLCESLGSSSRVTWSMHSKLPFFLFWMKGMMTSMIGMDYDRGLAMLKEQLEHKRVSSHLEFKGVQDVPACYFVGMQRECSFEEMPKLMEQDFQQLVRQMTEANFEPAGPCFTSYTKWEVSKGRVNYEACCPVEAEPLHLPAKMISGYRPALSAFQVEHTGSYAHLANAWSAAMMRSQAKVFKQSKKVMPFEQYLVMPEEGGEQGTVTLVSLPLK